MFRVSQSKMLSLNISVTAPFILGMQQLWIRWISLIQSKEINLHMWKKCPVLFGKGTASDTIIMMTRSTPPGDAQLNIQSEGRNFNQW